ncbi:lactosylceramide 1,3-N-acetyl-beta-D-glucosaminyltransferase [Protobothrops mucrosquamatus]|uniref:lactosylceramide 1,3-N-acetyl-beta-D-glucosaminyltransferase n=1 Tax=Protobothrops mucrosquamatus TaxID=103944 RepID=UPI0007757054|nr:lactosylceramide 1,3-N-acetyl-beta-D-glucosaminyltransferase [Protobothrops mucrosquamatus]
MHVNSRRVRKYQFVHIFATCFVLCFMFFWVEIDSPRFVHTMKSFSYKYLINSYAFVNDSLTISRCNKVARHRYLINHEEKCQGQDVLLLIFVKSSPENYQRRDAIRQTWGNEEYIHHYLNANIKVLFVLGQSRNFSLRSETQMRLEKEDERHGDLIQQDFLDTFYNLTYKLLLQFSWANNFCPHAKFVMSADDDIFIHMPNLIAYLQNLAQTGAQGVWVGHVHYAAPPIRDKKSKYYVSYKMYPWPVYPDYTAGAAYVLSSDVAAKVYQASQTLNSSFYIDDVFMGLCANKVGIVPQNHPFFSGGGKAPHHPCIYDKMITSHGHVEDLQYFWRQITDLKMKNISSGVWGNIYCRIVNIMLLCRLYNCDAYVCSAAFS